MEQDIVKYEPIIYMDKKEPFRLKKIGFTEYSEDGGVEFYSMSDAGCVDEEQR